MYEVRADHNGIEWQLALVRHNGPWELEAQVPYEHGPGGKCFPRATPPGALPRVEFDIARKVMKLEAPKGNVVSWEIGALLASGFEVENGWLIVPISNLKELNLDQTPEIRQRSPAQILDFPCRDHGGRER